MLFFLFSIILTTEIYENNTITILTYPPKLIIKSKTIFSILSALETNFHESLFRKLRCSNDIFSTHSVHYSNLNDWMKRADCSVLEYSSVLVNREDCEIIFRFTYDVTKMFSQNTRCIFFKLYSKKCVYIFLKEGGILKRNISIRVFF